MPRTMAYYGEDFCITHGRDHMRSYMGNPIPFCQACEEGWKECEQCHGSGFSGHGTGYGDVCGECGGQKYFPK